MVLATPARCVGRRLRLVSCGADDLCAQFAAAAEACGWASSSRSDEGNNEEVVVALWDGDGAADWPSRLPPGRARLAVVAAGAVRAAEPLTSACGEFLVWPVGLEELALRLDRCAGVQQPPRPGRTELAEEFARFHLVGRSAAFLRVLDRVDRVARTEATVLIEGETGVGKELVARAIHYRGARAGRAFVPVNCGALPDTLAENELFGHEAGARRGLIDEASRGTLFLDEVEALSPKGQVVLLRFLQDQEFRPLGGRETRRGDVRVIAASNRPLAQMVEEGRFRSDLLYRLSVLSVAIPPLRERPEDIEPLCRRTLDRLRSRYGGGPKRLDAAALAALERRPWPGNVRELENVLHRAYVMSESGVLTLDDDEGGAPEPQPAAEPNFRRAKARNVAAFEREYLAWLMREAGGNLTAAAKMAGKERRALGRLLQKHNIRTASR